MLGYVFIIAWSTDIFGYLIGRHFGKHNFSKISPKKTIEGSIAGIVGSVIFGGLYILIANNFWGLNISSFLGIMILTGTAVNSGILIRSEIELGCSVQSAACSRLRTVFLSVLSTAMALFPVALLDTNPIQNCASISLLGGLLFGTAALFALIPFFSKEAHYEHS